MSSPKSVSKARTPGRAGMKESSEESKTPLLSNKKTDSLSTKTKLPTIKEEPEEEEPEEDEEEGEEFEVSDIESDRGSKKSGNGSDDDDYFKGFYSTKDKYEEEDEEDGESNQNIPRQKVFVKEPNDPQDLHQEKKERKYDDIFGKEDGIERWFDIPYNVSIEPKKKPLSNKGTGMIKKGSLHKGEEGSKEERLKIIVKIENYCQSFPGKISNIRPIDGKEKLQKYLMTLNSMSLNELLQELDVIRLSIGRFKSYDAVRLAYLTVVDGVEKSGKLIGFDIEGYKKDVEDNHQIDDVIKELSCEYSFDKYLDPKMRLLGLSAFQLMSTNKKNKIMKQQTEIIQKLDVKEKFVNQETVDKYKDL